LQVRDSTQSWVAKLEDKDAKVRVQAVQQLRKLKAKETASRVAALLKDPLAEEGCPGA